MIYVKNEESRKGEAINYVKNVINDLTMEINQCDYIEDVNGKLVRCDGAYEYEKRALADEKYRWEKMLQLLTMSAPFSMLTW